MRNQTQKDKGYSKAIDIWSVGCVTATLLTGETVFGAEEHNQASSNADATVWDLSFMDQSRSWRDIGRKVKSFIRACLNVDEAERWTAEQALNDPWFTNKHYAADLEAAYQRAVQDWKPRDKQSDLVEFIDTSAAVTQERKLDHVRRPSDGTRSVHFPQPASSYPMPDASNFSQIYYPPAKLRHTPLPAIFELAEDDHIEAPPAHAITSQRHFAVDHIGVTTPPPWCRNPHDNSIAQLSITEFAPPETQFNCHDSQMQPGWRDNGTQSQAISDSLPVSNVSGVKRKSESAALDGLDEDFTGAAGTLRREPVPQKKVCR